MPPLWLTLSGALLVVTGLRQVRVRRNRDTHRRGALIDSAHRSCWLRGRAKAREAAEVTLGHTPVAPLDETKHFKLIGTTGTGLGVGASG